MSLKTLIEKIMAFFRPLSGKTITPPPAPTPVPVVPVNAIPANTTTGLNSAKVFSSATGNPIRVADTDSPVVTTIVSTDKGVILVTTNSGVTIDANNSPRVSIAGSPDNINRALEGMFFVPYLDVSGVATINVLTSDGSATDKDSFTVTIAAVAPPPPAPAAPPVVTVPGAQTITGGATSKGFSGTGSNQIIVADSDSTSLNVTIGASNGKFKIAALGTGATILNNDTSGVTLTGTPAQITNALQLSIYTPNVGFSGVAVITVTASDGTQTDSKTISVFVSSSTSSPPPSGPTSAPFVPFGSRLDSINGKPKFGIAVSDRSIATMDADLKNKYLEWRSARVYNVPAIPGAKAVKFTDAPYPNTGNALTVSEGIGYGMLLSVFFEDQATFDGLLKLMRARPAYAIPGGNAGANLYLMDWKLGPNGESSDAFGGGWNAMDGDLDMAMGMLMADRQWGTSGTTWNYMLEAQRTIGALKAWNMNQTYGHTKGGATGDVSRTSDWMFGHFRAFGKATNDSFWIDVAIPRMLAMNERIQTVFSAANGGPGCFVPDAVINTDGSMAGRTIGANYDFTPNNITNFRAAFNIAETVYQAGANGYVPSPGNRLDFTPTEMHYFANAQRCAQRWGNDYINSGEAALKTQSNRIVNYIKGATGGVPQNTQIGYRLNGGLQGPQGGAIGMGTSWPPRGMVCGFGCAAQVDAAHQTYLNACYKYCVDWWTTGYYDAELMLMAMVAMSGNWWTTPGGGGTATTSITNSVPSGASTATNTAIVFNATNGNKMSVAYSGMATSLQSNVVCSHGTVSLTTGGGGTVTGNGTANAQVVGTLAQVNAALAGVTYTPTAAYNGLDTIIVTSTDGTINDADSIAITIASSAPPPAPAPGSTWEDIVASYFTAGNQGFWLDPTPASRFDTTATSNVPLSGYGANFGKWKDRSGRSHHFTETELASLPGAYNDKGGPHGTLYHGGVIAGGGGATNSLYICVAFELSPDSYYGTLLSNESVGGGIRIYHNADESGKATWEGAPDALGDFGVSVGNGTGRADARLFSIPGASPTTGPAYTVLTGRHVLEVRVEAGTIGIRLDKGTEVTHALGASTMGAGLANMMLSAFQPDNSDWAAADYYQVVLMKNQVPTLAERNTIASGAGSRAGVTI